MKHKYLLLFAFFISSHSLYAQNWDQIIKTASSTRENNSIPERMSGEEFGYSVAIDGSYAVVGVPKEGELGTPLENSGAAIVFNLTEGSGWKQIKKLVGADSATGDKFVHSVSISGNLIIVGAIYKQSPLYQWQVAENEVHKYELERITNGSSFISIGTLASKGKGTNSYNYTDSLTQNTTRFYRVKKTSTNGSFDYSSNIKLNPSDESKISFYPNPVQDKIMITGASTGSILFLTDATGKILQRIKVTQNV